MPSIAHLIAQHRASLIQHYLAEASRLPSAREVCPQDILDNVPEYLDALCVPYHSQSGNPCSARWHLEERHLSLRLRLGYTQEEVMAEYVLLGQLLSRLWEPLPPDQRPPPENVQRLFDALQSALEHTASTFRGDSLEDCQKEKRALRRMDALAADLLTTDEPSVRFEERLEALLAVLEEALHADAATVLLMGPDGQRLHPSASSGLWRSPPDRTSVPVHSSSFVAAVASSTEVLHLPDTLHTHFTLGEGVRASGIHSLFGLRMWPRDRLLGVVYLGTTKSRSLDPRARCLLEALVAHLSGIIDRILLLQQVRQAQARLPLPDAEEQRLNEERLLLAAEATGMGTWDLEPLTGALHWDERCKALFGLPPDAPIDYEAFISLVHPEDREHVRRSVQQSQDPASGGKLRAEYRVVDPRDGSERWLSAHGRAVFDANGRAMRNLGLVLDITERVREREATEREKNRAITTLESISEAFLSFDRDWNFIYANREAERIIGQSRESLMGHNLWEVFPALRGSNVDIYYRRAAAERIPLSFENYYPPWKCWFELHVYPTDEGVAAYFQDITERKCRDEERERLLREQTHLREEAEKSLRERQRAMEVLEHGEALFVLDKDARLVLVNENQERISHTRREDTLGRVLWDVFPAAATPDSAYWREYHRVLEQKVPAHFEEYYAPLDLWTSMSIFPISEGGVAAFFRDITEHKRAEQFRDRLMGIVSHDLRNPLHNISLATELLLRREDLPEPARDGVRRIARSADRMSRMITDLLDFTRARVGGGIPLQRRPIELGELVRATLEEFAVTHPGRLVLSAEKRTYTGEWDPDRLAQVLSNLVGNALQHGDEHTPVDVALREEEHELVLSVTNQGPPIPESQLPHIFDPFRRATSRSRQGLGLGLYIVQQIVQAHGGSITVSSSATAGTTFSLRLPFGPARS